MYSTQRKHEFHHCVNSEVRHKKTHLSLDCFPLKLCSAVKESIHIASTPHGLKLLGPRMKRTTLSLCCLLQLLILSTASKEVIPAPGRDNMLHTNMDPLPHDTAIYLHHEYILRKTV